MWGCIRYVDPSLLKRVNTNEGAVRPLLNGAQLKAPGVFPLEDGAVRSCRDRRQLTVLATASCGTLRRLVGVSMQIDRCRCQYGVM